MDSAIREAISASGGTPVNRQNLLDVLTFLERRGASPAVMQMAMERAGIHPDVAQLIARCAPRPSDAVVAEAATPATAAEPAHATAPDRVSSGDRSGRVADRALHLLARGAWLWLVAVGGGLATGIAVGYEIGVGQGFEAGLDRLAMLIQGR